MKGLWSWLACSGCVFGAGPTLGVQLGHGPRVVAGAEVSGGLAVLQLAVGDDTSWRRAYARLDAGWDGAGFEPSNHLAGLVGGRVGLGGTIEQTMFVLGPSVGVAQGDVDGRNRAQPAGVVYLDLRYSDGSWQLVVNPRVELHFYPFPDLYWL